jgi:flagellar hook-associated protein 3 FlgL
MTFSTLGDLAQAYALRHRNTAIKTDIQRLNQELATGQAADLAKHLGGSYAELSGIERNMRLLEGYSVNITEAKQLTDVMQIRLEQISTISTDFAGDLITSVSSGKVSIQDAFVNEAALHFQTVVETLNSQSAGRFLFSGDATNVPALVSSDAILTELNIVLTGATSRVDIEARIDSWFSDPTGFEAFAYTGGSDALGSFKMSETTRVSVDIRANSDAIKDLFASFAKVIASDASTLDLEDQRQMRKQSATELMTAQEKLIGLQAELGLAQEQIENWGVQTATSRTGLDYAKGALLSVDPYERATELEAAQFQLESLYTITARLSRLSLVNFLR